MSGIGTTRAIGSAGIASTAAGQRQKTGAACFWIICRRAKCSKPERSGKGRLNDIFNNLRMYAGTRSAFQAMAGACSQLE